MEIIIKRIYDEYSASDGYRVLVDRLWPRGIKKEDARIDRWAREIAPSEKLRKCFDHDRDKWDDFKTGYMNELAGKKDQLADLLSQLSGSRLTLLYAARDRRFNNAVVLKEFLENNKELLNNWG